MPVAIRLAATDTGRSCQTGADSADGVAISGTEADLLAWLVGRSGGAHLAWLVGRSGGAHLARDGAAELPRLPSSWAT